MQVMNDRKRCEMVSSYMCIVIKYDADVRFCSFQLRSMESVILHRTVRGAAPSLVDMIKVIVDSCEEVVVYLLSNRYR